MNKIIFSVLFLAMLTGCHSTLPGQITPLTITEGEGPFDRFEFRSTLSRKETATVKDLVILVSESYKEERDKHDYAQWYNAFVTLGWIEAGLKLEEPCTRGQVGRLVSGRLNLRGNLFLLFGHPSERYGFREIMRLGFLKKGYPNEHISGSTLMNIQSRSTTWVKKIESRHDKYKTHTATAFSEAFQ
jgi:hypothetical protein